MWCVVYPDELYHHGIKGQKWGIRRFQNPDGSLTAAGRKRYNVYEDGSYARKSGRTKRLEKAVTYARMDEDSILRMPNVSDNSRAEALRGLRINREAQETRLAESRERDRYRNGNGKKIAVAVGATVAAAVATGLAVKYRKEIGEVASTLKNEKIPTFAAKGKNLSYNLSDRVNRKASSSLTKAGMLGRQFIADQKGKAVEAINKGISEGSNELAKASMIAIAGIGAKKLSDAKERYDQSGSKNKVTEVLLSGGNKGVETFISSLSSNSGKGGSGNGKTNGSAGATVGKDLANKLGPARQEHYSPSEQKRYDRLFQDNNKVKGNDEVRLTVKALKRAGYSIDQIETYIKDA